jgi:hypothetical protein
VIKGYENVEVSLRFKQVSNPKKIGTNLRWCFLIGLVCLFLKMGWTIKIGHDLGSVVVKGNKVF